MNDILLRFYKIHIYKCNFYVTKPDFIVNNLENKNHFTFLRIGDGEQFCIQSQKSHTNNSHNRNGCNFDTPGLADSILNIINDKKLLNFNNIFIAWNPSVIRNRFDCFSVFNKEFNNTEMNFYMDHTILIKQLISNPIYMKKFINNINKFDNIIYVGPKYMNNLQINPIKFNKYIDIPDKNCFEMKDIIYDNIINSIKDNSIILFSGGLGIKYVIYKLYNSIGNNNTLIDLGSVLDPFFDNWSRRTYKKNKDSILKTLEFINFINE